MGQAKQFDPNERLERAVDTFWKNGFGVGMQDLCKAMDLFPGSLYGTYGGKRQLFMQAVDRYMAASSKEAIGILERNPSGLGALRDYFESLINSITEGDRRWGCLVTNSIVELAQSDPEIKQKLDQHLASMEHAFSVVIDRARKAEEIPADTPLQRAGFLVCMVEGMNVLAKMQCPRKQLEAHAEAALLALGTGSANQGLAK
jgi:TetR/AcrR family transcriptional regulator, transcriptional repressor for nem operon